MPKGLSQWIAWLIAQGLLTGAFRLIYKLVENAVLGWGDDQIAAWLGFSSPNAATVIAWGVPLALAALTLWGYHRFQVWFAPTMVGVGADQDGIFRRLYLQGVSVKTALGPKVTLAWVLIIGAVAVFIVGVALLVTADRGRPSFVETPTATNAAPTARPPQTITVAPTSAPKVRPRYEPEEIGRMLKMVGELRDILDMRCAPTYSQIHTAMQTWRRDIPTDGAFGIAKRFSDLRVALNECGQAIARVFDSNLQFRDEIFPTVADDKNSFGDTASILSDLTLDLNELGKASNINVERFITPKLQSLETALQKFGQWVGQSNKRLAEKQKELREWKNP